MALPKLMRFTKPQVLIFFIGLTGLTALAIKEQKTQDDRRTLFEKDPVAAANMSADEVFSKINDPGIAFLIPESSLSEPTHYCDSWVDKKNDEKKMTREKVLAELTKCYVRLHKANKDYREALYDMRVESYIK